MTFQLSASVAVKGFRERGPRTDTRSAPPYRPEASPWAAIAGGATERMSAATRPRIAATATLWAPITAHLLRVAVPHPQEAPPPCPRVSRPPGAHGPAS